MAKQPGPTATLPTAIIQRPCSTATSLTITTHSSSSIVAVPDPIASSSTPTIIHTDSNASSPSTSQHSSISPPLHSLAPMLDLTLEKIKLEQDNDKDIQLIISNIHGKSRVDDFVLHNNLIYRLIIKRTHGTTSKVPYLPALMVNTALIAFHDYPVSGHFGVLLRGKKI
jgi:hypothetical protein